jgi:C-terminal processing protease CtpA/Prc
MPLEIAKAWGARGNKVKKAEKQKKLRLLDLGARCFEITESDSPNPSSEPDVEKLSQGLNNTESVIHKISSIIREFSKQDQRERSAVRFSTGDGSDRELPRSTLGIVLGDKKETICFVKSIVPGSPAHVNGKVCIGDRIVQVCVLHGSPLSLT